MRFLQVWVNDTIGVLIYTIYFFNIDSIWVNVQGRADELGESGFVHEE